MHWLTSIIQWLGHQLAATVRRATQAEQAQRRFAEALCDSLAALTSSLDLENAMQQILAYAATVVPSEAGSIILLEGNYGHVAYLRGFPPEAEAFFKEYWFPTEAISGGSLLADKQPYFVPDTHADPNWVTLPVSAWIRSSIGVPIELRGQVIGMLVVDSSIPHHFQPTDIEKLQAFARYASLALENAYQVAQLEAKVQERTAELQAAKERVEAILHHSPDAILLIQPDLHIQQTNAAFHTLFACTPDIYVGRPLYDLMDPHDVPRVLTVLETALRTQTGQQLEIRCARPNGTLFEAEFSLSPITVATETAGFVCTIHDITTRKRTEAALQQALAQEKELGELKSRFLSMASHEFRTPLTIILLQAETLRVYRHKLSADQIEQRLGRIRAQVEQLQGIMEDVLQLSRLQARRAAFNPVPLDLAALYQSVLEELQSQAGGAARLLYTCEANLGEVPVDKKLMQQLITNLVTNALKYSPIDKRVQVSLHRTAYAFVFQVRDEGIGIPAADLEHVFEPFHRAMNVDSIAGTGLGLAIVKEAVELHGGTITVASEVGVGTTFTVNIPAPRSGENALDENSCY